MFIVAIVHLLFVIFTRREPLLTPCIRFNIKTIEYNVLNQLHYKCAHAPNIQSCISVHIIVCLIHYTGDTNFFTVWST